MKKNLLALSFITDFESSGKECFKNVTSFSGHCSSGLPLPSTCPVQFLYSSLCIMGSLNQVGIFIVRSTATDQRSRGYFAIFIMIQPKTKRLQLVKTIIQDVQSCEDEKEEEVQGYESESESLSLQKPAPQRVDVGSQSFGEHGFVLFFFYKLF